MQLWTQDFPEIWLTVPWELLPGSGKTCRYPGTNTPEAILASERPCTHFEKAPYVRPGICGAIGLGVRVSQFNDLS